MATPAEKRRLTYQDYLALEQDTDLRHQFLDGKAWPMAGGTPRHSRIRVNLTSAVGVALGNGPCQPFDSDLKLRVLETGLATYPDLAVVCGPLQRHPEDHNAVTNPTVVVEVLSDSTESWDRGGKFAHYRQIPSLQHFVLVGQDPPSVELYSRQDDGSWRFTEYRSGDEIPLPAVGCTLRFDALFRNLPPLAEDPGESADVE